ncbi:MAG TPA: MBL fold metallo-hydrolase [Acidimicrobiia bacterium]
MTASGAIRLRFLGTGASGGTPGRGRSRRRESSLLVEGPANVLVDVTRDFTAQAAGIERIDLVLITHAHRDASGGLGRLDRWLTTRDDDPVPVLAHPGTIGVLAGRYPGLRRCRLLPTEPGAPRRRRGWSLEPLEVPHARDRTGPTCAWRLRAGDRRLVYASDVARITPQLERFARGAAVLVADGATYGRTIFTHLRIDRDLPALCRFDVGDILLTQIGRSAPPHGQLEHVVSRLCARARPAHDGLVVTL